MKILSSLKIESKIIFCIKHKLLNYRRVKAIFLYLRCGLNKQRLVNMFLKHKAVASNPSYVRPLGTKFELNGTTVQILNNIKDFTYNTDKDFLEWSYKDGLESGILPYSCATPQFQKFEKILAEQNPLDFNSLEPFLI